MVKKFKHYLFEVTGGFYIDAALEPLFSASGEIYGFKLPDGREVDIAICLRVEGPPRALRGRSELWYTDETLMEQIGFESLGYDKANFIEGDGGDDDDA